MSNKFNKITVAQERLYHQVLRNIIKHFNKEEVLIKDIEEAKNIAKTWLGLYTDKEVNGEIKRVYDSISYKRTHFQDTMEKLNLITCERFNFSIFDTDKELKFKNIK